jgi:dynamin 1-like protein
MEKASNKESEEGGLLYHKLRKLISVVDELRDVGLQQYINLPRIAVLGQQSSGKSSVLESIVGIDFLPRGSGVVTRRPAELRLVHEADENTKPWAEFAELKGQKFTDFDEVRNTIDVLTDKIAGKKKGIVDKPIVVTIHSHTCPDLTVIDLPGITRIPLQGSDQGQDIEKVTKKMALRYVKDPRTIILCVIPANADMTTSDALQMARDLDPKGIRTLGVITKIDIMDKGTNAKQMIMGHEVPLRLGYVGVKNRSQQDINDKMRVKKALAEEKLFFSSHPIYSTLPSENLGTVSLTKKLTKVLFTHIKNYLPQIVKEINIKRREVDERLRELGPPLPSESTEKMQLLWNMVTEFCTNFRNTIGGRYITSQEKATKGVSGGARIKHYYYKIYKEFIGNYSATSSYSDVEIERAIKIHEGYSMPGFPSVDVFIYLLQPQLNQLREPAMECLQDVYLYLESLADELAHKVFARFPALIGEILEVVSRCLQEEREKTKEILECLIDSEEGYLFTNDYDYLLNRTDIVPGNKEEKKHLSSTTVFVMELRQRIDAYFSLVIRNVRDRVPKTIGNFLVKKCQDKIQFHLYSEINKNSKMHEILGEHPAITQERMDLSNTSKILKNATKVLQRDPDITNVITIDDKLERDLREDSKEQMMRKKPSESSSGSRSRQDMDAMSNRSGASDFRPPGSDGEPYDRSKRESMNPHMMRAQQQQHAQQPLSQTHAPPQQKPKSNAPPSFGNLFGD